MRPTSTRNILIAIGLCVLCGVAGLKFFKESHVEPDRTPVYTTPRHIQYSFTIQNTTNQVVNNSKLWVFAPVKNTATQRCDKIDASQPFQLLSDPLDNQVLYFEFSLIPPHGTKIITVSADLMLSEKSNSFKVADVSQYTKPEKFIESDHPDIIRLSEKLRAADTLNTVRKYFDWVSENIHYTGYLAGTKGAEYALTHKKGDCTEFAYLFTALCRAGKIPSRCIGGFVCRENSILKPADYHNWAEIYKDSSWLHVDPQKKVFMEHPAQYIAMRIIGNAAGNPMGDYQRFRVEGRGLKVRMNG